MSSHFEDPRFFAAIAPTMPGQGFGTPPVRMTSEQQETSVRLLLNDIFRAALSDTDPLRLSMIPDDVRRHGEILEAWAFYEPDLLLRVRGELATQYGIDPFIPGDVSIDAGLAAALNQILSTAETRSEQTRTTLEGVTTVTREGEVERERDITVSQTRFIEMPTAEEFMNDFTTGFAAFTVGLRKKGLITRDAADWMMDNPDFFYSRYIAMLSELDPDALFQAVGATGEPIFLGERVAGTEEIESTGIDRERILTEVLANEREQIESEVIRDITSTGTIETTEQQQQVDSEIDRRIAERTQTLINEAIQFYGTETTITTEQVFSIPRPTSVFKIPPLSFLSSQFSAHAIENLAAGRRGSEQARRQTAQGTNVSAPRRIGGV